MHRARETSTLAAVLTAVLAAVVFSTGSHAAPSRPSHHLAKRSTPEQQLSYNITDINNNLVRLAFA